MGKRVLRLRFATLRTNGGNCPRFPDAALQEDTPLRHSRESMSSRKRGRESIHSRDNSPCFSPSFHILPTQSMAPCMRAMKLDSRPRFREDMLSRE